MELRIVIAASALAVAGLVLTGLSSAALGAAKAAAKWPSADRPAMGVVPARIGVSFGVALCGAAAGLGASMAPLDDQIAWLGAIAAAVVVTLALMVLLAVKLASKIELSALINSTSPVTEEPQTAMPPGVAQQAISAPPTSVDAQGIAYGQPYPGLVTGSHGTPDDRTPPRGLSSPGYAPAGSPVALPDIPTGPAPDAYVDAVHTTTPDTAVPATQSSSFSETGPPATPPAGDRTDPSVPAEALPGWVYTDQAEEWYLVTSIPDGRRLMRLADFSIVVPGTIAGALNLAGSIEMTVWPADADADDTGERDGVADDS